MPIFRLAIVVALAMSCGDTGCPPEEIVSSPLTSNLVESTEPPAGDVLPAGSFASLRISFLQPIAQNTFDKAEDIKATRHRQGEPSLDFSFSSAAFTEDDSVLLQGPGVGLVPGDVIRVSILGRDQIGDLAVASLSGSVMLAETVTVRFTIADPAAGRPGAPEISSDHLPDGLYRDPIAPDDPYTGFIFVEPHAKLLFRFSEPMGVVGLVGEVRSERSRGSMEGMDFRSFVGLQDRLDGHDHTGVVRNAFFAMLPGATYELTIAGADAVGGRLPASKDLSGEALPDTFQRFFRTSHVRIAAPFQAPYADVDLRDDFFIRAGVMVFEVTGLVMTVRPVRGVTFAPINRWNNPDPLDNVWVANDVQLSPDGSGLVCVEAITVFNLSLGRDCLRVFDESKASTVAVVGKEGGTIRSGRFGVRFVEADTAVLLDDGTEVVLGPSLRSAVEFELGREPAYTIAVFSLLDTYHERLPDGVSLDTPAGVSWDFDPDEAGLPVAPRDLSLGTVDDDGDFLQYSSQLLLPWTKVALVDQFSPTKASNEKKNCNDDFEERVLCCRDQVLYECDPIRCARCCDCENTLLNLTADRALCWCSNEVRACCADCSSASTRTGEECHIDTNECGQECSQADLDEASRVRCVKCGFSDCEDANNAVASPEGRGRSRGTASCSCNTTGNQYTHCSTQPDGGTCCSRVGTLTPVPGCTTSVPEWDNPPHGCEDDWSYIEDKIQRHEDEHSRREAQECNVATEQFNHIPTQCDANSEVAKSKLEDRMKKIDSLWKLRLAAHGDFVDSGEAWDVPPLDCNCAQ